MPDYDEELWNAGIKEQTRNCYDYALNREPTDKPNFDTDRNRDPGDRVGKPRPKVWTCANAITHAEADGVDMGKKSKRTIALDTDCGRDCYKVALYVAPATGKVPDGDYHWARQDADDGWSHKMGAQEIRQEDDDGNTFDADPSKAVFRRPASRTQYTFCAYGCVCTDKLASTFPSVDGPAYASVRLKEPAALVSPSMDLLLPPGRLTVTYAAGAGSEADRVTAELALYSGAENPTLELTPDDTEALTRRLAGLPAADRPEPPVRGGFLVSAPPGGTELPRFFRVVDDRVAIYEACTTWFRDENDLAGWLAETFLERAPLELSFGMQGVVKAVLGRRRGR